MTYKNHNLVTSPDGKGFRTVAYFNGEPAYASYSEHPSDLDSETKCKMKIDGTRPSAKGQLKFKEGDKVDFVLNERPLFSAEVVVAKKTKKNKPYTLKVAAKDIEKSKDFLKSDVAYAHENYLIPSDF